MEDGRKSYDMPGYGRRRLETLDTNGDAGDDRKRDPEGDGARRDRENTGQEDRWTGQYRTGQDRTGQDRNRQDTGTHKGGNDWKGEPYTTERERELKWDKNGNEADETVKQ